LVAAVSISWARRLAPFVTRFRLRRLSFSCAATWPGEPTSTCLDLACTFVFDLAPLAWAGSFSH
jgi:hypothetical protein